MLQEQAIISGVFEDGILRLRDLKHTSQNIMALGPNDHLPSLPEL